MMVCIIIVKKKKKFKRNLCPSFSQQQLIQTFVVRADKHP